jgi:hypothetical protein
MLIQCTDFSGTFLGELSIVTFHRTKCRKWRAGAIAVGAVAWPGVQRGFALRHEYVFVLLNGSEGVPTEGGEGIAKGTPLFPARNSAGGSPAFHGWHVSGDFCCKYSALHVAWIVHVDSRDSWRPVYYFVNPLNSEERGEDKFSSLEGRR